jgi:hypothetical protein
MVANAGSIVSRVLKASRKSMSPSVARAILSWRFSNADKRYVSQLLEKNQEGTVTEAERAELRTYVVLEDMVDTLQAQAELAMKNRKKRQAA